MDITTTPAWSALQSTARPAHLRTLFANDPHRSARYRLQAGDLLIDYAKNQIDDDVVRDGGDGGGAGGTSGELGCSSRTATIN